MLFLSLVFQSSVFSETRQAACDNMKAHVRANCGALPHVAITNAFYFSPGSKFCCAKPKPRQETEKKHYKRETKKINVVSVSCFSLQRECCIVDPLLTSQSQHLHCNYFLFEHTPKKKQRTLFSKMCSKAKGQEIT